jgi:low affinity Fe/Cu permease
MKINIKKINDYINTEEDSFIIKSRNQYQKKLDYAIKYKEENKEKIKIKNKEYRQKNREKINAYANEYYHKNKNQNNKNNNLKYYTEEFNENNNIFKKIIII